jgi:hypothetical protein
MQADLTESDLEVIIDIANRRAELIDQLQEALKSGDTLAALDLARRVCGLPDEEPNQ